MLKQDKSMSKNDSNKEPGLDRSLWDIERWYETRLGRLFYASERRAIRELLSNVFGYHSLQLSIRPDCDLSPHSKINHRFALAGSSIEYAFCRQKQISDVERGVIEATVVTGVAQWTELPFADESIDVCVLHHALEFTEHSQQVLKEVARVLRPRGYILILGFNPYSFEGLKRFIGNAFTSNKIYQRRNLSQARIEDWLDFLDCSLHMAVPVRSRLRQRLGLITKPRKRSAASIRDSLAVLWAMRPFAAGYGLLACKDRIGVRPNRELGNSLTVDLPVAEPSVASRVYDQARRAPDR